MLDVVFTVPATGEIIQFGQMSAAAAVSTAQRNGWNWVHGYTVVDGEMVEVPADAE